MDIDHPESAPIAIEDDDDAKRAVLDDVGVDVKGCCDAHRCRVGCNDCNQIGDGMTRMSVSDGNTNRDRNDNASNGDGPDDIEYVERVDCPKQSRRKKAFFCPIPYCDEHIHVSF